MLNFHLQFSALFIEDFRIPDILLIQNHKIRQLDCRNVGALPFCRKSISQKLKEKLGMKQYLKLAFQKTKVELEINPEFDSNSFQYWTYQIYGDEKLE